MASSQQYTVGTAPTLLAACPPDAAAGPAGWFYFTAGTAATLYLGGPNVTSGNGAQLAAAATLTGYLFSGDQIYAVTASGTSTVGVLQTGA